MKLIQGSWLAAPLALLALAHPAAADTTTPQALKAARVLLISVDGMHQQDLAYCLAHASCPNIAALAQTGVNYSAASTPGLSDSFPGLAALFTGGSPKSAGLFYDVTYDRALFAPSDVTCSGKPGWNVVFDETTGIDGINGGKLSHLDGGGNFNPQAIPHALIAERCVAVYPHNYIKTNTVFEVIKQQRAGARTAWTDKHAWAYDWLNGPSGKGVDDLGRTEINSIDAATNSDYSDVYTHTEVFDNLHLQIILNQINGQDSTGRARAKVPTLFGTNFQTLSVAQKANHASGGGYKDAAFTPGSQVTAAISYIDGAIGQIVTELNAKKLLASTLVIVTAKHGQSPADPGILIKHGDTLTALLQSHHYLDADGNWGQANTKSGNLNDGSGVVASGMVQTDDVGLIWLRDQSQLPQVVATLEANKGCGATGICADSPQAYILSGDQLAERFGDPALGRTPDIIVQPNPGVIYSDSKKKDAEHGGNAADDRHVALLISLPQLKPQTNDSEVELTQVAPTMLQVLGLNPMLLNAVKTEGTQALPGLGD